MTSVRYTADLMPFIDAISRMPSSVYGGCVHRAFAKVKVDVKGKEGEKERKKGEDDDSGPTRNGEQARLRTWAKLIGFSGRCR
jgi:hypothetical protein